MLVERTDLTIDGEKASDFETAMSERGVPLLKAVSGVLAVSCGRGVEHPTKFMLLVTWESMDAHHAYNATTACAELRALIGGFAPKSAAMEHFDMR